MKYLKYILSFFVINLISVVSLAQVKPVKVLNQNIVPLKRGIGSITLDERIKLAETLFVL